MHRKITWTGLTLWLLHASNQVSAQAPDTLQRQLQEVTITASRTPQSVGDVGRSVTVLDSTQLANASCTTLGELLARLEGIYLIGAGQSPGANQTIFLRGSNSNQTAIYLDGVRINDVSSVNGVADLSELPVNSLERVEILRGAHSTVYSSAAVGGVVLLQTKQATRDGWNLQAYSGGGIFREAGNQWNTGIQTGYRWKSGFWVAGDADLLQVRGIDATVDTSDVAPAIKRDQDDWRKANYSLATGWRTQQWNAQVRYRRTRMDTDIDRSAYTDDNNYTLDFERNLLSGEVRWNHGRWDLGLTGGWTSMERISINDSSLLQPSGAYDGSFADDRYTGSQLNADLFAHYRSEQWSLLAGINGVSEQMNQEHYYFSNAFGYVYESRSDLDTVDPRATQIAPYLQLRLEGAFLHKALRPLSLVAGARQVNHDLFGSILTYELNPSWKLDEHSILFASFSTGYNAPSLYQLFAPETYMPWDGTVINPMTRGNRDLTPEISQSLEFGIRQRLSNTEFSFSLFRNRTDDIIDYVYLWNNGVPVDSLGTDFTRDDYRGDRYINLGDQVSYGAELSVRSKLSEKTAAFASMSMVDGYLDIRAASSSSTGGYTSQAFSNGAFLQEGTRVRGLVRRPNTMSAGLEMLVTKRLQCTARVQYVGSRSDNYYEPLYGPYGALGQRAVNDYTLLDLFFSWKCNDHLHLTGRLENVMDTRYEEILGFSSRGRGLYLRLSYSI